MKRLVNTLTNASRIDLAFYGIGGTFVTIIVVFCIAMIVHIINNPGSISFGSF